MQGMIGAYAELDDSILSAVTGGAATTTTTVTIDVGAWARECRAAGARPNVYNADGSLQGPWGGGDLHGLVLRCDENANPQASHAPAADTSTTPAAAAPAASATTAAPATATPAEHNDGDGVGPIDGTDSPTGNE